MLRAPVFRRLVTRGPFAVELIDGEGPDLVIAFASIGHDPARRPAPEFVATATGRGTPAHPRRALFVTDDSRSWASDPAFGPTLTEAVGRLARPVARLATLGLSMGAVMALRAAEHLPVDVTLAFGPQSRLHDDPRWHGVTAQLPELAPPGAAARWTVLCHGLADDAGQAAGFPPAPGTDRLGFPGQGHSDLVPHLKSRGALAGLMQAALAGDRRRLLRIASSAGATRQG